MRRVLSCCLLLFALASVMVFIWGDLFVAEFQSDTADTLLWAKASYESGGFAKEGFYYPYIIPIGGNLLFMPFFTYFGMTITAIRCGMTLFVALLTLVFIFFFDKVVFRSRHAAFSATGLMLLIFLTNTKLREIMYGHIIHYSPAIMSALLIITLLTLMLKHGDSFSKKNYVLYLALYSVVIVFSINGTAVIALGTAPVCAAFVLEWLIYVLVMKKPCRKFKREFITFCLFLSSIAVGYVINGFISEQMQTPYSNNYFVLMPPSEWLDNLRGMAHEWLYWLFRPNLYADTALALKEPTALGAALQLAAKVFMLVSPIALLLVTVFRYRKLETRSERIVVLSFWVLAAITVGLYMLTPINSASWRMIPMFSMMFVCWFVFLRNMVVSKRIITRVSTFAVACVISLFSLNAGVGVLAAKAQPEVWLGEDSIIEVLKSYDAEYCFCDSFHFCPSLKVLSNGELQVENVECFAGKLYPLLYQNEISDFEYPEGSKFYYIRTANFEGPLPEGGKTVHTGTAFMPSYKRKTDQFIEYEIIEYSASPLEPYFIVNHSETVLDADGNVVADDLSFLG